MDLRGYADRSVPGVHDHLIAVLGVLIAGPPALVAGVVKCSCCTAVEVIV